MKVSTQTATYARDQCAPFMRSREKHGQLSNMTFGYPLSVNGIDFQGPEGLYQALKYPGIIQPARPRPNGPSPCRKALLPDDSEHRWRREPDGHWD